ncbi:TniB family NTP-binding protein [Pseudomonas sp. WS 5146]|uniref:TniB family NTP-binding protein n=1 Tax=Pseudomonas sp. WS 5146 TaxID=2717494 RepID=UPI0014735B13|nr:TniB family NTP-binding protein [Pseudomonas sp. WS 5146]NMX59082.1 AAA family ATPase [Pseudomonas sp. WS 5146]
MSDYPHIHPDFRAVMSLSDEERIRFIQEPRWIGYPAAHEIISAMRALLTIPSRPRMPNLLLVGDSNNGKTTIIRRFVELYGQGYVNAQSEPVKPVILVESPPAADEKGLYISILESFWAPYRASDATAKLRYQVVHMFRSCHVRLLVIDEFHSLLTGSAIKQREVMNALKLLCNTLAIPIVGVGTSDAVRVLHTDPQHASRFDVVALRRWEPSPDFQRLIRSFESILPLRQASVLSKPELALALHSISGGNTGDLHRLLMECAKDAIITGSEKITKSTIEKHAWLQPTRGIRERV